MVNEKIPYAFTGRFPVFRNRIVSDIILCSPDKANTTAVRVRALWDTGCTRTMLTPRVAEFLQLPDKGKTIYRGPFGDRYASPLKEVKVCIVLGGEMLPLEVGVNDAPSTERDCDVTLGLDFISMGDFAMTYCGEQLWFSFCYPPIGSPVDFTQLAPQLHDGIVITESVDVIESRAPETHRNKLAVTDQLTRQARSRKHRKKSK